MLIIKAIYHQTQNTSYGYPVQSPLSTSDHIIVYDIAYDNIDNLSKSELCIF